MTCSTTTGFPLSYQQERAWSRQLAGGSRRATCWLQLSGVIDTQRLQDSIRGIVARHEILRTSFVYDQSSGYYFQQVQDSCRFSWTHEDLQPASSSVRAEQLQRWLDDHVDCGDSKP